MLKANQKLFSTVAIKGMTILVLLKYLKKISQPDLLFGTFLEIFQLNKKISDITTILS